MLPTLQIQAGQHKRFLNGYPWLYANEIIQSNLTKELEPGHLVTVEHHGKRIATGFYNRHSLIAFRKLCSFPRDAIDSSFFKEKLLEALKIRERFYKLPYYRLIHAEADGLPGLIIDRFDATFVIQINTQGIEKLSTQLVDALQEIFNPTTLYLRLDSPIRKLEGLPLLEEKCIGTPLKSLKVIENETEFLIDLSTSQKTGWFYDHQPNRKLIATLAKDKRIIDYFCYSGGFSLQATKQGAQLVIGVDSSEAALLNAKNSAIHNQISSSYEFVCDEAFKDMDKRTLAHQKFDIVILDPPAFVKTRKDLPAGLKGYEKLITKALPLLEQGGLLLIASCSYHVKKEELRTCLTRALYKNNREGKILQTLSAGPDHPEHPMLEESNYLKGFLVAVY